MLESAERHRILVTGAHGDIADAIGRILKSRCRNVELIGADASGDLWPGLEIFEEVHPLPRADSPNYIDELLRVTNEISASLVIPATEPELKRIASEWEKCAGLALLCNEPHILGLFFDKLATANWLTSIGVSAPLTVELGDACEDQLPLVVKPRSNSGSRDVTIVRTREHLDWLKRFRQQDFVAQAFLADDNSEFTCALTRVDGILRTLIMRRKLSGGLSSSVVIETDSRIQDVLDRIGSAVGEFVALNVQLRMTDAGPRVFEINPRFSSTVMLRHLAGFEDVFWACAARLGWQTSGYLQSVPGTRVFRRFRELLVCPQ